MTFDDITTIREDLALEALARPELHPSAATEEEIDRVEEMLLRHGKRPDEADEADDADDADDEADTLVEGRLEGLIKSGLEHGVGQDFAICVSCNYSLPVGQWAENDPCPACNRPATRAVGSISTVDLDDDGDDDEDEDDEGEDTSPEDRYRPPFGFMPVCAFRDPALRMAAARYWDPTLGTSTALGKLMQRTAPAGIADAIGNVRGGIPIRVRLVIDYPLAHPWAYTATVPSNELGRIFAIVHDMYRIIYAMDDAAWERPAPRVPGLPGNRAEGKHVWGHDMVDLVFEEVCFEADPDAPDILGEEPFPDPPLIGTFTFFIGS